MVEVLQKLIYTTWILMKDAMNINELLAKGCKVSNGEHLLKHRSTFS